MKFYTPILLIALLAIVPSIMAYGPIYNGTTTTVPVNSTTTIGPTTTINNTLTPTFTLYNGTTMSINALIGGTVTTKAADGTNITVTIWPGTYVEQSGILLSNYNFTVATFSTTNVGSPQANQTEAYGFAFEVNKYIGTNMSFVNATGSSMPVITTASYPATWTSWAWLGGKFNGTAYVGGSYAGENTWSYNSTTGTITNDQFTAPIMWVFTIVQPSTPASTTSTVTSTVPTSSINQTTTVTGTQTSGSGNNTLLIVGVIVVIIIIGIVAYMMMKK